MDQYPSTSAVAPSEGRTAPLVTWVAPTAATILIATMVIIAAGYPLNHDVGWFMSVSRRMLSGERLYVDIVEVNPPLIAYLMMPPVLLADALRLSDRLAFDLFMLGLTLFVLVLSTHLVWATLHSPAVSALWMCTLGLALILVPADDFGQREHIMIVTAVPYVLIKWQRVLGISPRVWQALLVGLFAGIGFSLKPYFVPIWLMIEGFAFLQCRSQGRAGRLSVEAVVVGSFFALYGCLGLLFHADYLTLMKHVTQIYGGFGQGWGTALALFAVYSVPIVPLTVACMLGRSSLASRSLASSFLLLAIASLLMALAQGKGWRYHSLPGIVATVVSVGILAGVNGRSWSRAAERRERFQAAVGIALIVAAVYPVVILLGNAWKLQDQYQETLERRVAALAPLHPASILVLGDAVSETFPLVNRLEAMSPSPFASMWWIRALYGREEKVSHFNYRSVDAMGSVEKDFFSRFVQSIVASGPDVVLVDTAAHLAFGDRSFPYVDYFSQDSAFRAELKRYRGVGTIDHFIILAREGSQETMNSFP